MPHKTILVVGATGQQGGALIDHLLKTGSEWKIYGLTRDLSSDAARALSEQNFTVVQGNALKLELVFAQIGESINTIFAMTQSGEQEEYEGKAMVDAAITHNVKHFVYSSVDRGGPGKSSEEPTFVPHFISKHNIERHLMARTNATKNLMAWTILRPVTFMDNFVPGFLGGLMARVLEQMNGLRLQLISTEDIGKFALVAISEPILYDQKAYTLAADSLNYDSVRKIFQEQLGCDPPLVPLQALPTAGAAGNDMRTEDTAKMVQWFNEGGYNSDLAEVKSQWAHGDPALKDFRTWLKESTRWGTSNLRVVE